MALMMQGSQSNIQQPMLVSTIENQLDAISVNPQLLKESAGEESCCIFRVPHSLATVNPKAYEPKVVSIGPYHAGKDHLKMIEEHKNRFLKLFLEKAKENGVDKRVLFEAVIDLEEEIRRSYSEDLVKLKPTELLSLMVLDGCFILMLFLIVTRKIRLEKKRDPIFTIPWILPSIRSDLLLLENQVPFCLLQILFEKSRIDPSCDFNQMVFAFFNYSIDKPEKYWLKHRDVKAKHLLDLIRKTYVNNTYNDETEIEIETKPSSSSDPKSIAPSILSAKKLRLQGIKFRRSNLDSILAITLEKNKLKIPLLRLDGFISSFFLNAVAFEQFYTKSSNHITSYVVFMGCLLDSEEDATFLTNEKRIIENYFGNEAEVSQFFKNINKDIAFDVRRSYLAKVFEEVNTYTSKWYTGVWAEFRHTHFDTPWTCASSAAVALVLILAGLQLLVAYLSYNHDTKKT